MSKTGSSIDVFLSSDGQSIPLGHNWVHGIEKALDDASLMVVFVSPNSIRSNWLFFEAGYAYSKRLRVVPVGFLGVDLGSLAPPLSLLQGFNITSEAGLNNVIAITNSVFTFSHQEAFTHSEFLEICSGGAGGSLGFGEYGLFVANVYVKAAASFSEETVANVIASLAVRSLEYQRVDSSQPGRSTLSIHGMSIFFDLRTASCEINLDPLLAELLFPVLEDTLRIVRQGTLSGTSLTISFARDVDSIRPHHKLTGRVHGFGIGLAPNQALSFGDLLFKLSPRRERTDPHLGTSVQRLTISVELKCDALPLEQFRDLLRLLFEREVIFPLSSHP